MRVTNWHKAKSRRRYQRQHEAVLCCQPTPGLPALQETRDGVPYFTIARDGKRMHVYLSSPSDIDFLLEDLQNWRREHPAPQPRQEPRHDDCQ